MTAGNNSARRRRGAQTQAAVAAWFAGNGWPYAESTGSSRMGVDVTGLPGIAVEVKARRDLNLTAWLRQAAGRPGVACVVHRPDGMGVARVAEWPVTLTLAEFTKLLQDAGYGDGGERP
jgi:hypothetical protein